MSLKQQMKQTLGMTMTPQLQQAIKILQMSVLELQQEVNNALIDNPTLEEVQGDETPEEIAKIEKKNSEEKSDDNTADTYESIDPGMLGPTQYKSTRNTKVDEIPQYEQILSRATTLFEHLMWQFRMSNPTEQEMLIAEEIIGNLNEDGYLVVLLEEIQESLKVSKEEVEAVLYRIQRFDPTGVAARDLQECLLIQAEAWEEDDEVEQIIKNHLPELENKNYTAIAKAMDLDLPVVVELCRVIHSMEPKPGRQFVTSEAQYFVPDIYIVKVSGEFVVVLNEEGIPRLSVSPEYKKQLDEGAFKGETKSYVKEKLKDAHWLLKSIYQRQKTIYRVTQAILKMQSEFFEKGSEYLKPMILKDVADELSLHESTISRVTTNKFVHTPHGIFELKYFFNSGIKRADGSEDMASISVKQKIKELVSSEDPKKPLSDQQIVDILKATNIKIARRTVAKYREAMQILPSNKRKKYF